MSDRNIDDLLKDLAGTYVPSDEARAHAESRLQEAIEAEKSTTRRRFDMRWVAALAAGVVALFFVAQAITPSAASARFEEIASVAERLDPLTAPDGSFLYTRSEQTGLVTLPSEALASVGYDDELHYLLTVERESWLGSDNTRQIRSLAQPPIFFSSDDEAAYYSAGLDEQDQIGEVAAITVTEPKGPVWSEDPAALDEAIRARMTADRGLPRAVEYLDVAITILREARTSPQLRASILRLVGNLEGLELLSEATPSTFAIEYEDQDVPTIYTFTLDSQGHLRAEERRMLAANEELGIPADTSLFSARYEPPVVVDSLEGP